MGKKFNFSFEQFEYEQIKAMTMEDLNINLIRFKRMIKEARRVGMETSKIEVEFCYLDNERQLRDNRDRRQQ